MSPISGTHLRLPCFGFSLTNTIFERAKIFPDLPDYIKSVYGIGYKFEVK